MAYYHIILEPQLFLCLNFVVKAESREAASNKLKGWCNYQVEQSHDAPFTRKYWNTGLRNIAFMKELNENPDFHVYAFVA